MQKKIDIAQGDITQCEVDVIVNAANTSLLGGGGVDGAIHRTAGPKLLEECRSLRGCPTGQAKLTGGYDLKAQYVIHTAGPVWHGGQSNEEELLAECYRNSCALAEAHKLSSIAFPCISTGVYRFPKEKACAIAIREATRFLNTAQHLTKIIFVCFNEDNYALYTDNFQ